MRLLLAYLMAAVFAEEYELTVVFGDREGDDSSDGLTYAEIEVNDVYLFCKVRANKWLLERWKSGDHRGVAKCLCHEACHLLTQPIASWALMDAAPSQKGPIRDVVERQTERICRSLMRGLPTGFWNIDRLEKWNKPCSEQ